MSWSAYGAVSIDSGDDNVNLQGLTYSPPLESMSEEMAAQAEFLKDCLIEAAANDLLDGDYSVSMSGHADSTQPNDRKSLSFNCSPAAAPANAAPVDDTDNEFGVDES